MKYNQYHNDIAIQACKLSQNSLFTITFYQRKRNEFLLPLKGLLADNLRQ